MNNGMSRQAARLLLLPTWMIAFAILIKGYSDAGDFFVSIRTKDQINEAQEYKGYEEGVQERSFHPKEI